MRIRHHEEEISLKTPADLVGMRAAGVLAAKTLEFALSLAKPGVATGDIDAKVADFIRDHGATAAPYLYGAGNGRPAFPKSICTSINDVICHGIPGAQTLKEGDIVCIDVTVILDGWHGDSASTIPIGPVSDEAHRLMRITYEAQQQGIEAVKPGKRFRHIAEAIQNHAESAGFSVVEDFVGHGIGREFHEPPQVNHIARPSSGKPGRDLRTKLEPGMTFTIEPMINAGTWQKRILKDKWTAVTLDGRLSAQYEHTIAVTDDGYEILTLLPGCSHKGPGGYFPE